MIDKPEKNIQTCSNCGSTFDLSNWGFHNDTGLFACTAQCTDALKTIMVPDLTLSELLQSSGAREYLQHYSLFTLDEDGNPCFEPDLDKWAHWIDSHPEALTLAVDERPIPGGATAVITTVFLGRDCNPCGEAGKRPHLFETEVTFGPHDPRTTTYRCATRTEALKAHADTLEFIQQHGGPKAPSPNRMPEQ